MFNVKEYKPAIRINSSQVKSLEELFVFELNLNSTHVPIFLVNTLIQKPHPIEYSGFDWFQTNILKDINVRNLPKYSSLPIKQFQNFHSNDWISLIKLNKQNYLNYLNNIDYTISKNYFVNNKKDYKKLFSSFTNTNYFNYVSLPLTDWLVNQGCLIDIKNDFKPLMVAVTNNLKYLKLCHLTERPVNPSAIEIWVDESFYSDSYKSLRIAMKNHLKEGLNDYKIVRKENLSEELFITPKLPALPSISKKKEFEASLAKDFITDYLSEDVVRQHGIILTD